MGNISFKNSTKNLDRCKIRTHTYLIRSRDKNNVMGNAINSVVSQPIYHHCQIVIQPC
jgi:hypothetical protein